MTKVDTGLVRRKAAEAIQGKSFSRPMDAPGDIRVQVHAPAVNRNVAVAVAKGDGLAGCMAAAKLANKSVRLHNAPLKTAAPVKGEHVDTRGRTVFYR